MKGILKALVIVIVGWLLLNIFLGKKLNKNHRANRAAEQVQDRGNERAGENGATNPTGQLDTVAADQNGQRAQSADSAPGTADGGQAQNSQSPGWSNYLSDRKELTKLFQPFVNKGKTINIAFIGRSEQLKAIDPVLAQPSTSEAFELKQVKLPGINEADKTGRSVSARAWAYLLQKENVKEATAEIINKLWRSGKKSADLTLIEETAIPQERLQIIVGMARPLNPNAVFC